MDHLHFDHRQVQALADAAVEANLADAETRRVLFTGVMPKYVLGLKKAADDLSQLQLDLGRMNQTAQTIDGKVPLEIWLENAAARVVEAGPAEVFRTALATLRSRLAAPRPSFDPATLPERKEVIVLENDMLPFSFLEAGRRAGAAVARLQVPRFKGDTAVENQGRPVMYGGTGWLMGPRVLVTNHHVIHARAQSEPMASDAELKLQAQGTEVEFGYDGEGTTSQRVKVERLLAADARLDAAVLLLREAPGAVPLRVCEKPVDIRPGTYLPVNIIQHPLGRAKTIAIRNNLVTRSEGNDLRYFTDTEEGSSGSPVLNDAWEVVALHRGAIPVWDVQFQGRNTAWVNTGTRITAILAWLRSMPEPWSQLMSEPS